MAEGAAGPGLAAAARAKANLRLRVFSADATGYHGVETVLLKLELADEVRLVPGGEGIRLSVECRDGVDPESIPTDGENLCLRAARLLESRLAERGAPVEDGFEIRLVKRIPAGAGLGGGSADAAAVLRLMNEMAGAPLELAELVRLAGELGSDVPFGLLPGSAALGWSRGHRLLPLEPPSARPALVAFPAVAVATPEAYRWLDEDRSGEGGVGGALRPGAELLPEPAALSRWEVLSALAANDFEEPVFRRHPELQSVRELMVPGAMVARLAGSGGALFAVYPDEAARDRAGERVVEETGVPVRPTRTLATGPADAGRWPLV